MPLLKRGAIILLLEEGCSPQMFCEKKPLFCTFSKGAVKLGRVEREDFVLRKVGLVLEDGASRCTLVGEVKKGSPPQMRVLLATDVV